MQRDTLPVLATFKNPSFSDEAEVRLVTSGPYWAGRVKFRAGALGVTPYVGLPFHRTAVAEVVIGPASDLPLRKAAVESCLVQHHYDLNRGWPATERLEVTVSTSESSARS